MPCTSCISFDSYIKPQLGNTNSYRRPVVYLLIPTSNHNFCYPYLWHYTVVYLLIPTSNHNSVSVLLLLIVRCISFDSYIKPQLWGMCPPTSLCCISFDSYIKPQPAINRLMYVNVVYLLIPTSNHNKHMLFNFYGKLYIFWFLHQTTTGVLLITSSTMLYIFWFLHQTTTLLRPQQTTLRLYIFWFLHQTTTVLIHGCVLTCCISFDSYIKPQRILPPYASSRCCISFDSYIKPQHTLKLRYFIGVVYLLIPTSNHNLSHVRYFAALLYIFWFLHQTTTYNF